MDTALQNIVIAGLLLLIILVTGFWVSRSGKSINMIKMDIHKLIALGTAIFISLIVYRASKGISLNTMQIATLAASVVFALVAINTGGLASLAKPVQIAVIIHKITPDLAILSTAAMLKSCSARLGKLVPVPTPRGGFFSHLHGLSVVK